MKNLMLTISFVFSCVFSLTALAQTNPPKKTTVPAAAKPAAKSAPAESTKERKSASDGESLLPTHFKKDWKVEVVDYDLKSDTFEIALRGEEEAGPFYFTPAEFLKGTGNNTDLKSFSAQKKKDMVGAEMVLKEDMKIMSFEEYIQSGGSPETF